MTAAAPAEHPLAAAKRSGNPARRATAKKPVPVTDFNLDKDKAARAAKTEATGADFRFTFGGEAWSIPPAETWPLEVSDLLPDGKLAGALRLLMGDEQYARFAAIKPSPTFGDLTALFTALGEWSGLTLGEMMSACIARFDPDIEAAMRAHYGIDTLKPGISLRRMWVFMQRLPHGLFPAAPGAAPWSLEATLLAGVLDALNSLTWVEVAKAIKNPPKPPAPLERPWDSKAAPAEKMNVMQAIKVLEATEGVRSR